MERYEITSHLNWLVSINRSNPNKSLAVNKWREDIRFIENYRRQNKFVVKIDEIRVRKKFDPYTVGRKNEIIF